MRVNMLGSDFRYERAPSYSRRTGRNIRSAVLAADYRYERAPSYTRRPERHRRNGTLAADYTVPSFGPDYGSLYDDPAGKTETKETIAEKAAEEKKKGFGEKAGDYMKELVGIIAREGSRAFANANLSKDARDAVDDAAKEVQTRNLMIGGGIAAAAVVVIVVLNK